MTSIVIKIELLIKTVKFSPAVGDTLHISMKATNIECVIGLCSPSRH